MSSEYNKTSSKRLARLYRTAVSSKRHKSGSIGSDIPDGQTSSLSIIPEAPAPAPEAPAPAPEAPAPAPAPEAPAPEAPAPAPEAPAPEAPAPEAPAPEAPALPLAQFVMVLR